MYHYVRELEQSRYPKIKALRPSEFEAQLTYLSRHYEFVRLEDCVAAIQGEAVLPLNAALLTFDDGYIDHFTTVFPLLVKRGIQGAFFPPVAAIQDREMLDVNKIHFVLASAPNYDALLADVFESLDDLRPEFGYPDNEELFSSFARAGRFDDAGVVFVKRLLQKGLPRAARQAIVDRLFSKYVSVDAAAFAHELYMTPAQLSMMADSGMFLGAHGVSHEWLGELSVEEQIAEVETSLTFLYEVGGEITDWAICYPYGSYNDTLLDVLRERGCRVGLTSRPDVATLSPGNALTLPRLDTNDFPKCASAGRAVWTQRVARR